MTMLRPIMFADLDDTFFQSLRKVPDTEHEGKILVSEAISGNHSYQTIKQQNLFAWLSATTDIIPVTARSSRSFANVQLDFGATFKIVGNGAVVIKPDGEIDEQWHEILVSETSKELEAIHALEQACLSVAAELGIAVRCPQSIENGIRHSVIVKQDDPDVKIRLNEILAGVSVPDGWMSHLNSNNLAFTVPSVSKKRATEYVMSQIPDIDQRITFGLGDSFTDMPFMGLCDFFATPMRGQVAEKLISTKYNH
jgi:hydroxymethylpyrimidine pyrophosphatase-like HAD family hydrolase